MTVFTPGTVAASFAAEVRSISLATLPDRVTTPFADSTVICLFWMLESDATLACTWLEICASLVPLEQATDKESARVSARIDSEIFAFMIMLLQVVAALKLDARKMPGTAHGPGFPPFFGSRRVKACDKRIRYTRKAPLGAKGRCLF